MTMTMIMTPYDDCMFADEDGDGADGADCDCDGRRRGGVATIRPMITPPETSACEHHSRASSCVCALANGRRTTHRARTRTAGTVCVHRRDRAPRSRHRYLASLGWDNTVLRARQQTPRSVRPRPPQPRPVCSFARAVAFVCVCVRVCVLEIVFAGRFVCMRVFCASVNRTELRRPTLAMTCFVDARMHAR